jgi:hypothetical protein
MSLTEQQQQLNHQFRFNQAIAAGFLRKTKPKSDKAKAA